MNFKPPRAPAASYKRVESPLWCLTEQHTDCRWQRHSSEELHDNSIDPGKSTETDLSNKVSNEPLRTTQSGNIIFQLRPSFSRSAGNFKLFRYINFASASTYLLCGDLGQWISGDPLSCICPFLRCFLRSKAFIIPNMHEVSVFTTSKCNKSAVVSYAAVWIFSHLNLHPSNDQGLKRRFHHLPRFPRAPFSKSSLKKPQALAFSAILWESYRGRPARNYRF